MRFYFRYLSIFLICTQYLFALSVPIGVNLEEVNDYARNFMFVDLVKSSRGFGSPEKPWNGQVKTDATGWPIEDFGIVVFTGQEKKAGKYLASFLGKADVKLVSSSGSILEKKYDPKANLTSFTIELSSYSNQLMISFTNTNGGIKELKIFQPGYPLNSKDVFNQKYLELLRPFQVIRLMDLLKTNNNLVSKWGERAQKNSVFQSTDKGVAWEYIIDLANQTKKDIWVNIPYLADDDYVTRLANLLKGNLRNEAVIYIELSNEIWNKLFKSNQQNKKSALSRRKNSNTEASNEILQKEEWQEVVIRLHEIHAIFEVVFGKDSQFSRIRPVLASQIAYPEILKEQLAYMKATYGEPKKQIYAIAGAPYFHLGKQAKKLPIISWEDMIFLLKKSIQSHVEQKFSAIENWDEKSSTVNYATLAKYYGLRFLAYEGGPDTAGANEFQTKKRLHGDKQMGILINQYLSKWYACGGDLFMYYKLSGAQSVHGSWGMYESIYEPSEKSKAVLEIAGTDWNNFKKMPCK